MHSSPGHGAMAEDWEVIAAPRNPTLDSSVEEPNTSENNGLSTLPTSELIHPTIPSQTPDVDPETPIPHIEPLATDESPEPTLATPAPPCEEDRDDASDAGSDFSTESNPMGGSTLLGPPSTDMWMRLKRCDPYHTTEPRRLPKCTR